MQPARPQRWACRRVACRRRVCSTPRVEVRSHTGQRGSGAIAAAQPRAGAGLAIERCVHPMRLCGRNQSPSDSDKLALSSGREPAVPKDSGQRQCRVAAAGARRAMMQWLGCTRQHARGVRMADMQRAGCWYGRREVEGNAAPLSSLCQAGRGWWLAACTRVQPAASAAVALRAASFGCLMHDIPAPNQGVRPCVIAPHGSECACSCAPTACAMPPVRLLAASLSTRLRPPPHPTSRQRCTQPRAHMHGLIRIGAAQPAAPLLRSALWLQPPALPLQPPASVPACLPACLRACMPRRLTAAAPTKPARIGAMLPVRRVRTSRPAPPQRCPARLGGL
jgi:hypothetical protein